MKGRLHGHRPLQTDQQLVADPPHGRVDLEHGLLSSRGRRKDLADNQEILAVLDRQFDELARSIEDSRTETRQQLEALEERADQRFERLEGEIRHAHVRIESLDGSVRQLAESILTVDQKVDRLAVDMSRRFSETHALIRLSHKHLDDRLTALEGL
jgi:chromosome segregation ATPase